jgi:arylsulfatase
MTEALPADRPNILLIMSDQHRADALGAAGHPVVQTPYLDRLAAEGVRYERAYCQGPLCMPARASFLTERYVRDHGVTENRYELEPAWPTFVGRLREAGYHTAAIGKLHLYAHAGRGDTRDHLPKLNALGFDEAHETAGKVASRRIGSPWHDDLRARGLEAAWEAWAAQPLTLWQPFPWTLPVEAYQDVSVGRETATWIDRYDGPQPFFLQVGFPGPHSPWDAPPAYVDRYRDAPIPLGTMRPPDVPAAGPLREFMDMWYPTRWVPPDLPDDSIVACRRAYYAAITLIDEQIGAILAALDGRDMLDRTWVVYTTDHGEMMGDHRMYEKVVFYEPSVRVPLIIRPPGGMEGRIATGLGEHVDVPATLRAAAGAGVIEGSEGHVLTVGALTPGPARRCVAISENHGFAAFVTDRHKLIVWEDTREPVALFDREADPDEDRNVIDDAAYAPVRDALMEEYALPFLAKPPLRRGPHMVEARRGAARGTE